MHQIRHSHRSSARKREQLLQLSQDLTVPTVPDPIRDAMGEMSPQQHLLELFDRALNRVGLLQDINAVRIFLDHLADAAKVTFNGVQAPEGIALRCLHVSPL
jgi:hypothetical protein